MRIQTLIDEGSSFIERSFSVQNIFLFGSVLLATILALLFFLGILPLPPEYFLFYSLILFLACLARPNWMFLLFITLLPLEIVSVTPLEWGFHLRPYQWVGGLLGVAVGIRFLTGRLKGHNFHWHPVDIFLSILGGGVILSGLLGHGAALKQTFVVVSFIFLYFLSRLFLRTWQDVKLAYVFFLVPATLSVFWGVIQNVLFLHGADSLAVMPGRPNGTLDEPDWLGLFTLFLMIPTLFWLRHLFIKTIPWPRLLLPWGLLLLICTTLILTVSRSAWLSSAVSVSLFFLLAFYESGKGFLFRPALALLQCVSITVGLAFIVIETVPLTRFVLLERAGSTVSQDQVITIACDGSFRPPERITSTDDLARYHCRHILLEAKEQEQRAGNLVTTTLRPDPNVSIRKHIYTVAWATLREHPIFGIGWGNIGPKLGIDERGASYNASNVFLELWLGGGLLALGAFLALLLWVKWQIIRAWRQAHALGEWVSLMVALLGGFLVFNMFNTGILLGFVWVWLALLPLVFPRTRTQT